MARIWILGGGLIGCGWAAAFAGGGHEVTVIDPAPGLAERLARVWGEGQQVVAPGSNAVQQQHELAGRPARGRAPAPRRATPWLRTFRQDVGTLLRHSIFSFLAFPGSSSPGQGAAIEPAPPARRVLG